MKPQLFNDWYAHRRIRSRQQFHDREYRSGKSADDGPVETNVLEVLSDLRLNLPHQVEIGQLFKAAANHLTDHLVPLFHQFEGSVDHPAIKLFLRRFVRAK